jgi:hypothetical protein
LSFSRVKTCFKKKIKCVVGDALRPHG